MKRGGGVHTVRAPKRIVVWYNKVNGRIATLHPTKRAAVQVGRWLARANQLEHTIHRKDGVITEKNSYGRDPRAVRG